MAFLIFNLIAFIITLILSITTDRKTLIAKENTRISNYLLISTILFLSMSATIALMYWGPPQLALFIGKLTIVVMMCQCVLASAYIVTFPKKDTDKKSRFGFIIKSALCIAAVFMVFVIPDSIRKIGVSLGKFEIKSSSVFSGSLAKKIPLQWKDLFFIIYVFIIPAFSMLMALVRAENTKEKLLRQKRIITSISVATSWVFFGYIYFVKSYQPLLPALMMISFLPEVLLIYKGQTIEEISSFGTVFRGLLRFSLRFLIPSCITGTAFIFLWPLYSSYPFAFFAFFIPVVAAMMVLWYYTDRLIVTKEFLRDNNYASKFEKGITSIEFSDEPQIVTDKVFQLFKRTMTSSSMKILVTSTTDTYKSVYSSDGGNTEIKLDPVMFDMLLTAKRQVVFREWAEKNSSIISVRPQIMQFLNQTNSEAFIILNEGRTIVSIILLGKKLTGNIYSEYDYGILNKYYSNIFVIGYYVKNIMNEAVIGTVNREIRMSDQIITSIQENMDKIKNPKVDVGYLMIPAHNIGGEFVDMIRLNEQRYIFIIGAMSGKGIAASMNMVILKSIIRTFLAETKDFKLLVEKVNTFIRESLPKGTFFAGVFGLIDFTSDTLYYINCGSPALLMYTRAYNNVIEIQGTGRILGFVEDISSLIKVKKVKLSPGDMILACTDGLIESKSLRGEIFGKQRIQHSMTDNSNYPAERMAKFTYDSLVQFTSKELDEDVTIFLIKYLGAK